MDVGQILAGLSGAAFMLFVLFAMYAGLRAVWIGFLIYRICSPTVKFILPIALFYAPSLLPESAVEQRKSFMRYVIRFFLLGLTGAFFLMVSFGLRQ